MKVLNYFWLAGLISKNIIQIFFTIAKAWIYSGRLVGDKL